MSRGPRILLAGHPHHVVQRGHNRQAVFSGEGDFAYYLRNLREGKEALGCKVYAYCLMRNHVHLVVDPGEDVGRLPALMKLLAARQTRLVNWFRARTGTLWEGRYRSSPIATESYLFACCRYVENNPVRAGIVDDPVRYRWSSHALRAARADGRWLDSHAAHLGMAPTPEQRARACREWVVASSEPAGHLSLFRAALQRGQVSADASALRALELRFGRSFERRGPGRPPKEAGNRLEAK